MTDGGHVSDRWAAWRAAVDLPEYASRWEKLAADGHEPHGEADLITSYRPASVLDAGCGMGRVAIELHRRGIDVVGVDLDDDLLAYARRHAPKLRWEHADLATMRVGRQFDVVAMAGNVMIFCRPDDRGAIVRTAADHLHPGGLLIAGFGLERRRDALTLAEYDEHCDRSDLELVERFATWERGPFAGGDYAVSVHRLGTRR
jgi:2-polyprenyl-3-methyl-5-hydroxy-6-metoxy-1,4-benzoquinol methylase